MIVLFFVMILFFQEMTRNILQIVTPLLYMYTNIFTMCVCVYVESGFKFFYHYEQKMKRDVTTTWKKSRYGITLITVSFYFPLFTPIIISFILKEVFVGLCIMFIIHFCCLYELWCSLLSSPLYLLLPVSPSCPTYSSFILPVLYLIHIHVLVFILLFSILYSFLQVAQADHISQTNSLQTHVKSLEVRTVLTHTHTHKHVIVSLSVHDKVYDLYLFVRRS